MKIVLYQKNEGKREKKSFFVCCFNKVSIFAPIKLQKTMRTMLVNTFGGGTRYNSDSRKGAVLVCIYLIKDITDLKEPCRNLRQGSFYLPIFEQI